MNILQLHEQFCQYCSAIKNYRPSTIRWYRQTMKRFLKDTNIKEIEEAKNDVITTFFYNGRIKNNWSSSTFINHRKALIVFFKWCVKNKFISQNPFDGLEKPKLEKRLPKNLTVEETFKLLEITRNYPYKYKFLRTRNYAIMAMFVYCGIRANELLHLKYSDIDLENKVISIQQGKGAKDRLVPIPSNLIPILQNYLKDRLRLQRNCPEFFTSLYKNIGLTQSGLKRLVEQLKKTSKIHFYPHMLRHTFATLMLEGGCDIFSLSKMMGHSDIKTTTIYLSTSIQHLKKEAEKHPLQAFYRN